MVNNVIWAGKEKNFEGLAVTTAATVWEDNSGYSLEMAIPTSITAPNGVTYSVAYNKEAGYEDNRGAIGYDLMLNNAIDSSSRQNTYTWSAGVGAPAAWNTLQFMDEVPEDLRSSNSEKVVIPANFNVAAGATAYSSSVAAFEQHTFQAVDGNMENYTQGLAEFWTLTVDFRYEVEIAKIVVKTHRDVYPTKFKVEYYNSRYGEWEILWDTDNMPGQIMTCLIKDQIGKFYITEETVTTRFIRFVPYGRVEGKSIGYSYALHDLQAYTPDKMQTVAKLSNKEMPINVLMPPQGGNVTEPVPENMIVDKEYNVGKVNIISPQSKTVGIVLLCVFGVLCIASACIYIILLRFFKGRKSK
jgi:hypothetical protein